MPPLSDDACKDNIRSSGLPTEYKVVAPKPPPAQTASRGPCKKCKNKRQGMKYIQPEVPAPFKPEGRYQPSKYPLESGTIYKLSYPGFEAQMIKECRAQSKRPAGDNIRPSSLPLSQETTFRLSYTGTQGERTVSYKPIYRCMMGSGPMQSITTQRHDFVPKVTERPEPFRVDNSIQLSSAPMENATTMSLSYQPVSGERVASFKPEPVYRKSEYKIEQDTINKLSYQPWHPVPKEDYPWMKREQYQQPAHSMEDCTIYKASYLPVENYARLPSFKPVSCISTTGRPFESATIYKESYQDNGIFPRPEKIVRRENINLSNQPMSQETTFRLSYTGAIGEKPASYKPIYRCMMGSGPMQSMTTQRHDFTPKPFVPVESCRPPQQSVVSPNYKMEDLTTFKASYQPNEPMPKTQSCKPVSVYQKSPYPLESDTINKLSYLAHAPCQKEEYPWMKKPRYEQPQRQMEGLSIYRGSYMAPGMCINDDSGANDELCECQLQCATDDL